MRQSPMPLFRLLFITLAALVGLSAMPAAAQVTAYASGQGAVNRVEVGIDVRASVRDRCGFASAGAPSGTLEQAEFDRTGLLKDFALRLNCSGASRVAVTSRNGALVQDATVAGFSSSAPYEVQLRLAADNGTVATQSCDAATLRTAGTCTLSGTASGSAGLKLGAASTGNNGSYLRISAPPYAGSQPLLAGDYSDTLTITVSVAP